MLLRQKEGVRMLWFSILFLPLIVLVLFTFLFSRKFKDASRFIELSECTVIIPFRNESMRLKTLIDSLLVQEVLPVQLIFCNDHSEDHSKELISACLGHLSNVQIVDSPGFGKKEAIACAVDLAKGDFCITLDADVELPLYFFSQKVPEVDLLILPVNMTAEHCFGRIAGVEYGLFNALNHLLSPIYVLSASGACLLFKTEVYRHLKTELLLEKHLSGDDYFLLRAMQRANKRVRLTLNPFLDVSTAGPERIGDYFQQRIRWVGKTGGTNDWKATTIGSAIFLYFLAAAILFMLLLTRGMWLELFALLALRFGFERLVLIRYYFAIRRKVPVVLFFGFVLIYPFLFNGILFLSAVTKGKWKGRDTVSKS